MTKTRKPLAECFFLTISIALGAVGCGEDGDAPAPTAETNEEGPLYAIGSSVYLDSGTSSYLRLVDSLDLEGSEVSLDNARELPGDSDIAVYGGMILVSSGDAPTITKYEITSDATLQEVDQVSFVNFGASSAAFYHNQMVSSDKAYLVNGAAQIIIWNPETMEITGTIDLPELEERPELRVVTGLADRSAVIADGHYYLPLYWTDDQYAQRSPDSVLIDIDIATDTVTNTIEAPCPALDYGTIDDDGLLHFSNWTGGPGTYHVLETAQTCIATLDPSSGEITTKTFASIADGHEGAAYKYVGNGRFVMSVFDEVRADVANSDDPFAVIAGNNWQLWSYEPANETSAPVDGIDWNSGAIIHADINEDVYSLVPGENYASTVAYKLTPDDSASAVFSIIGWSYRLFQVRW